MRNEKSRKQIVTNIKTRLGEGTVDVELNPAQFELAVDNSLNRYRMRSSNATEESFIVMDVQRDVQIYTLPNEVDDVIEVLRRNMGSNNTGASIDPFSLAFTSNIYMAVNPGGLGGGSTGTLATYEFGMAYQKLIGRMFGADIQFVFNNSTKQIYMERRFMSDETVLLHVTNSKPDETLFKDTYAWNWLQDFAAAECKEMLGEVRSKFTSGFGGPQGSITLNGDALKAEALAEKTRLEAELMQGLDASHGYGFVIG